MSDTESTDPTVDAKLPPVQIDGESASNLLIEATDAAPLPPSLTELPAGWKEAKTPDGKVKDDHPMC
jgi:hypothetical protein